MLSMIFLLNCKLGLGLGLLSMKNHTQRDLWHPYSAHLSDPTLQLCVSPKVAGQNPNPILAKVETFRFWKVSMGFDGFRWVSMAGFDGFRRVSTGFDFDACRNLRVLSGNLISNICIISNYIVNFLIFQLLKKYLLFFKLEPCQIPRIMN